MADLARVKNNVRKMVEMGAPEADIDAYIAEEGVTLDAVRNFKTPGQGHANVPEYVPPGVEGYDPATGEVTKPDMGGVSDRIGAFVTGAADIPIAGPALKSTTAGLAAGLTAPFSDQSFGERYDQMRGRQEQVMRENPGIALAGQIAGSAAAMGPLAGTQLGARAFGLTGKHLGSRMMASGLSSAGISGADTAARGGDVGETLGAAGLGLGVGGAIPLAGTALRSGYGAIRDRVGGTIRGAVDPASEASRRVASALSIDRATPGATLGASDIAAAARNQQPLINADLGGETTRALARAAANQSPEARGVMQRVVSDRFSDQGNRVSKLVSRLTGGKTDDLMMIDGLRDMAAAANKGAYNKAFAAPQAQAMWHEGYEQLMQAPAFQKAAKEATSRGANRAAAQGFQPVKNPFMEVDGRLTLRRNADGSIARPTLQFWDQVKKNLDDQIGAAQRSGERSLASDIVGLKNRLVTMLDESVPEYQAARKGAAAFFGAEDAVDAGKMFARSNRMIPEYKRGILALKPAEREAFETGFASELIDMAKNAGERTNVINRMFGSPEAREKMVMAFGRERAREIEAFVRVETAMDQLRNAFGNSTTARQLYEMGAMGLGTWGYTGDFNSGVTAAALTGGARMAGKKIDGNVMTKMAEMLMSNDPKLIERAIRTAAASPKHMAAIDALTKAAGIGARAATVVGSGALVANQGQ